MKLTRKHKILIFIILALLCAGIYLYLLYTHWGLFAGNYLVLDKEMKGEQYFITVCRADGYFENDIEEEMVQCDQKQFDLLEKGNCYFLYVSHNHLRNKTVLSRIDDHPLWIEYVREAFVDGSDSPGTNERGEQLALIISDNPFEYGDGVLRCTEDDKLEYYNIVDSEIRVLSAAYKKNMQDDLPLDSTDDVDASGYTLSEAKIRYGAPAFAVAVPENGGKDERTYVVDYWTNYFDTLVNTRWFDDHTIGVMRKSSDDKYALYLIRLTGEV